MGIGSDLTPLKFERIEPSLFSLMNWTEPRAQAWKFQESRSTDGGMDIYINKWKSQALSIYIRQS